MHPDPRPLVVDRAAGTGGELVLRRTGPHHEIISNGVFLMDTRDGTSERLLVRAATEHLTAPASIVIGGLGVGFSLAEAAADPRLTAITVIEREPAVAAWHRGPLRPASAGALDDPRVRLHLTDLLDWLDTDPGTHDALCLDIDNGPHWTVTPGNARLYSPAGLDRLARRLTPRGVLAVWSAADAPGFTALLRTRFADVDVRTVPVPRGEPDVVYLARTPRAHGSA
ncbi:spermidine synthase [Actinomadura rubteroloni]|uniref:Spermidine synthase n=1 Tax=Actinomadura rubteroloni TaxID=1926885 RepID=A0A2P4UBT1_9ACTN|nr:spermidine synthase [Actinomadura rubteroloni]POM22511.1 spermidine synthase [Actinomadura rubteroloni]